MARSKSSRSSQSSSSKRSSSTGSSQSRGASARSSEDEGLSFSRAREVVASNLNLQTAGIALAGAGVLALVSTGAGRSLIRTAASTVAKLANENFGEFFGSSDEDEAQESRQTPSRQRDQARI